MLSANHLGARVLDEPGPMFITLRVLAKLFRGLAILVLAIGIIAALGSVIGGFGAAAAMSRVGAGPALAGAGLLGGFLALVWAGVSAFMLWAASDVLIRPMRGISRKRVPGARKPRSRRWASPLSAQADQLRAAPLTTPGTNRHSTG